MDSPFKMVRPVPMEEVVFLPNVVVENRQR